MESAPCKVAINPALPQIVDAGSAGGTAEKQEGVVRRTTHPKLRVQHQ